MEAEQQRRIRKVAILMYEGVEVLDFAGPFEVFAAGSDWGRDFTIFTVAEQAAPVICLGGLSVNPDYSFTNCPIPDILIVPGGLYGARREMNNENLTGWIREMHEEVELLLSVCTGALLLAKAGVLEGMRLTTNRNAIQTLREIAPESAIIDEDARYCDNGKVILSAGVSAGMDMSLYVLGRLFGAERAQSTALLMEYDWIDKQ